MRRVCVLLAVLAGWLAGQAVGYSNGKVTVACGDMAPQHGHSPRPEAAPYSVTLDTAAVQPGGRVTVTLLATQSDHPFKGFLLEARDAADPVTSAALGSFSLLQPAVSQLLACGGRQGSGVSHTSDAKKQRVQAVWLCPQDPPATVQFFASVVQKYKVLWVQIPGPVLSVTGSSPDVPPTTTAAVLPSMFSSDGCGQTKSCFREPAGCRPESDRACVFLSFSPDATGASVLFELGGPAEGYVALGLSLDTWMGKDDVYLCVRDEERVSIHAAFVSGRTHPEMAPEGALRDQAWAMSDGVIQCRFRRNVLIPQMENRFDLDQSYFLFLAHGQTQQGSPLRHHRQPLISSTRTLIVGPPVDLSGSRSPLLIKFHGVLMLVAWMWLVSTAVIFARHFKRVWPGVLLAGDLPWFQVHRGLMLLAVCLTSVAFMLPFVYRGRWSKRAGYHPYLGCTVLALAVLQPITAVFRPALQSPRRLLFNWIHRSTGTLLQILAVVCLFLGFQQQALLLRGPQATGALVGWLVWILLADLGLQLLSVASTRRNSVLQWPTGWWSAGHGQDMKSFLFAELDPPRQPEVHSLKKVVMLVFQIGNVSFLGVLINAIVNV